MIIYSDLIDSSKLPVDSKYPYGKFVNETALNANDGTPILAQMSLEIYAFLWGLAQENNVSLSGLAEAAVSSNAAERQIYTLMERFVRPIGMVIPEYPDTALLTDLYPHDTFVNASTLNTGGVWRVDGGNALAYQSGQQTDAFQAHTHEYQGTVISIPADYVGISNVNTVTPNYITKETTNIETAANYGTARYSTETRMRNRTYKLYTVASSITF